MDLKMHEAILAGAAAVRTKAGVQHETLADGTVVGCALGMANIAAGATYVRSTEPMKSGENLRSRGTSTVWGVWVKKVVPRPCDCELMSWLEVENKWAQDPFRPLLNAMTDLMLRMESLTAKVPLPREMAIEDIIPHLFDNHVACENPSWTIEQLADWVKVVEDEAEREKKERYAAEWNSIAAMPWPSNLYQPHYYVGIDWGKASGAVAPGNDIGEIPIRIPLENPMLGGGPVASNAPPYMGTAITLSMLQEMVEKVKALPEPTEEKMRPKLSPLMQKLMGIEAL